MTTATATLTASTSRRVHARSSVHRLMRAELRLLRRDPLTLTFVFAFPVVTMLIIGGSFGTTPDPAFAGQNPAHWYVASYLTVVIAATGLIMMPVHIASYRERGVLRRFAAAGFSRWSFALAELALGLVAIALSSALLLVVAAPVYGVPTVESWWRVGAGFVAGSIGFVAAGVLLGTVLPSARAAQAVGTAALLPVLPARRRRSPAPRHGVGPAGHRRSAAADPDDQVDPRTVVGHRRGHRPADRRGRPGLGRRRRRGPAHRTLIGW